MSSTDLEILSSSGTLGGRGTNKRGSGRGEGDFDICGTVSSLPCTVVSEHSLLLSLSSLSLSRSSALRWRYVDSVGEVGECYWQSRTRCLLCDPRRGAPQQRCVCEREREEELAALFFFASRGAQLHNRGGGVCVVSVNVCVCEVGECDWQSRTRCLLRTGLLDPSYSYVSSYYYICVLILLHLQGK
jgi:hypothetical protein